MIESKGKLTLGSPTGLSLNQVADESHIVSAEVNGITIFFVI